MNDMNENIVSIDGVSKKFCRHLKKSIFYGTVDTILGLFGWNSNQEELRKGEFWALENISVNIKRGECVGIIGKNGSGKSTLLRLLNGIYPPDLGKITINGRIGALIAVGAGFHPHLTGKENIFLNASLLGMSKQEIDAKFDEIVNFADIGEFLDAPVATYSSGMTVRLGFSIAIHSEPEILIADEVLAVGDLTFALKCYRKISDYRKKGGTLILVSHSIQLIRNTCEKVIWINNGKLKEIGETQNICDKYEEFMLKEASLTETGTGNIISNDPLARITKVQFLNEHGHEVKTFEVGSKFCIRINYSAKRKIKNPIIIISLMDPENIQAVTNYSIFDGFKPEEITGNGHIDFEIKRLELKPSYYRCSLSLSEDGDINKHVEWHDKAHQFQVVSNGTTSYGIFNPFPKWSHKQN
jgi:lipopolysaccharide transport system ATP-binding protein